MRAARSWVIALFGGYVLSIWLANWLLLNVGFERGAGPRTIPVWIGLEAPSGVLAAGMTFTLRDALQRARGVSISVAAILVGSLLSALLSPSLAIASGASFLIAELLDMSTYTPLQRRFAVAVIVSNIVGSVVDSLVFLTLAFGTAVAAALAAPSAIGKLEASVATLAILALVRLMLSARPSRQMSMPTQ